MGAHSRTLQQTRAKSRAACFSAAYSAENLLQSQRNHFGTFGTMPALDNPRHEAFAQAIFAGLTGRTRIERAQSTAYLEAYPSCSPGPAAWTNASRLLRRAKVWERIGELQAEANKRSTLQAKWLSKTETPMESQLPNSA